MSRSTGPHPILIPLFLAMAYRGGDCQKSLDDLINLMQSAKDALKSMQCGMETLQAAMLSGPPQQNPPPAMPDENNPPALLQPLLPEKE